MSLPTKAKVVIIGGGIHGLSTAWKLSETYKNPGDIIVLEKKDSVLSIKEALLKFDKKTEEPYVEVKTGEDSFERRTLKLGISDGVNVEVLEGVSETDEIKIWNKVSKEDTEEEESSK